jgi:predicted YcjX-like family ATPase
MPITTFAHSGKDAYQSLKKIQMEIDRGVNYKTYRDRIVDAKAEVDLFIKSTEAKENIKLARNYKTILSTYESARDIWRMKFERFDNEGEVFHVNLEFFLLEIEYKKYSEIYPILKDAELANEKECRKEQKDKRFSCLFRDIAIQILWGVASNDLESPYKYPATKYKNSILI